MAFALFQLKRRFFELKLKVMKNLVITSIIALLVAGWSIAGAQNYPDEYLGLPGDNLNLYAVMKLFQESETLEDFERNLNNENTLVNNLDLNGDNMVDYIMVYDYVDGNVHNIVLRVAINQRETQDVAVFTVQQFNDGSVQVQLIGDELLYGKNYIVEPYYAENGATPNPGYMGNNVRNNKVTVVHTTTYQVAEWPLIRFIFLPSYVAWRSSWYWGYRPVYWNPWRPFYWHTYYGYHSHWHHHYYSHYRHWHHHRVPHYKNYYYTSIRTYSPRITVNINKGVYRTTYSRPDLRKQGEVLYARKNNTAVSSRSSAERKSATVRSTRSTTNSSVRQTTGATRSSAVNPSRATTTTRSARTSTATPAKIGATRSVRQDALQSRSTKSSSVKPNTRAVRSTPSSSIVTRSARTSAPKKSATVSTQRSQSRSTVRPSSSTSRRPAPSV